MAKDPSVLFYTQDFLVGSSLLSPLQKGHYITLLCYQQQSENGSLTLQVIQSLMKSDFNRQWPVIREKFKEDENGFFNDRMRKEILRRKAYSESRGKNRSYENHMKIISASYDNHMENENENENTNTVFRKKKTNTNTQGNKGKSGGNKFKKPTRDELCEYFVQIGLDDFTAQGQADLFLDHYKSNGWKVGKGGHPMRDWKAAVRNWKSRMKNFKQNGSHQQTSTGKPGTSQARVEALKNWGLSVDDSPEG